MPSRAINPVSRRSKDDEVARYTAANQARLAERGNQAVME